jgi:hypothetical protein
MRFDKPDRRFRRRVVGAFSNASRQASRWLRWLSATAKTVPFIHILLRPEVGLDFINMLMIWFYAFADYFAIRSERFVIE